MEAFSNDPVPEFGASLLGAYWLDSPLHGGGGDCVWCAQMREGSNTSTPHATAAVEPELAAKGSVPGVWPRSAGGRLAGPVRLVMLSVAVCTVVSAMLTVVLA
jgi:hypothetical protein